MTKNLIQHIEGLEVTQGEGLGGPLRRCFPGSGVSFATAGWGEGKASAPQSDWNPRRFGANPPVALVNLQNEAALTVLSACGIPPL